MRRVYLSISTYIYCGEPIAFESCNQGPFCAAETFGAVLKALELLTRSSIGFMIAAVVLEVRAP